MNFLRWNKKKSLLVVSLVVVLSSFVALLPAGTSFATITEADCRTGLPGFDSYGGGIISGSNECTITVTVPRAYPTSGQTSAGEQIPSFCSQRGGTYRTSGTSYAVTHTCTIDIGSTTTTALTGEFYDQQNKDIFSAQLCTIGDSSSQADFTRYNECVAKVSTAYDQCAGMTDYMSSDDIAACLAERAAAGEFGDQTLDVDAAITDMDQAAEDARNDYLEGESISECDGTAGYIWDETANDGEGACVASETDTCRDLELEGFSWVVCPGVSLLSKAINGITGWLSGGLKWDMLINSTSVEGGTGSASDVIRNAWGGFLTIANIAFAIVFLIVIYSTATSTGLSNYSIKKIMPRLVIVAIGVNISYYICAGMADLSNMAGQGLYSLIVSLMGGGEAGDFFSFSSVIDFSLAIAGGIVLIIVALFMWSAVLIGLVTIFLCVGLRSVVLTMLVIISPLAFVAALLPNTEKWWKKWRDTYMQMLVVYPAFMVAWAMCQLVANISAQTESGAFGFIVSSACMIAPLFIIIPLFKSTSGLMGKITGLTQRGVNKLGAPLKKINQEQRALAGQRALSELRGVATSGLAAKKKNMDDAAASLSSLQKQKADRTFSKGESDRLAALRAMSKADRKKAGLDDEMDALAKKKYDLDNKIIPRWDDTPGSTDEEQLSKAQEDARTAAAKYRRQANGMLHRAVFAGAHRRAMTANIKHENELSDQQALGRQLSTNERFQRSYSGIMPGMDESTVGSRVQRALNQAQAIGDKQGAEERAQFKSFLDNSIGLATDANGSKTRLTNSMAKNLLSNQGHKVSLANGRELSFDSMTDNEKLVLAQQVTSFGSTSEVAAVRNAVAGGVFKDPSLRQAIATMVNQSQKKDFMVQGANSALLGSGDAGSHAEQLMRITQEPLEAGMLDRGQKASYWADAIDGLNGPNGVAALAATGNAKAQKSLTNLAGAIQAQLQRPGAGSTVDAVGNEYQQILNAYNAIPGATTIDVGALFASARKK